MDDEARCSFSWFSIAKKNKVMETVPSMLKFC